MLVVVLTVAMAIFAPKAWGFVDPNCLEESLNLPADYNETAQNDFLLNYFALSSTYSPIHGPIPHKPGHGSIGIDLNGIPPLKCSRRLVLNYTKTEDTNKSIVLPRPRASYAFKEVWGFVPYASVAYVPPVPAFGLRSVVFSGEFGIGRQLDDTWQVGARFHATSMRNVGEIATPFVEGEPAIDDLFYASTLGIDAIVGAELGSVTPFLAVGWVDASTFFWIGDDGIVTNNFHPYFGPTASLGAEGLINDWLRLGGEFYAAPGGHSTPDSAVDTVGGYGRYGHLFTARLRAAVEL